MTRLRICAALGVLFVTLASCGRESTPSHERTPASTPPGREPQSHVISEDEIEVLRSEGLTDPVRQIVESLRAHPEIIPHAGVLGGRMGFYSDGRIFVPNARTVFARFDDGHIEGSGVFELTVQSDSSVAWRVLSSRLEGPPLEGPPD